jgi:hypothetical protein
MSISTISWEARLHLGPFSAISSRNLTVNITNFDNLSLLECYIELLGKQLLTCQRIIMPSS